MRPWNERPVEIRNLFNPAFCGLVLSRALTGFQEIDGKGIPFSLSLLILPLCLHQQTRHVLRANKRSYFLKIVAEHPELQVGFARRCTDILPFTFEGLGLLMQCGALAVGPNGHLRLGSGIRKALSGTEESIECQRAAAFLGKEFAVIADRTTVYATLGVRP
jgi:hypothetical protein